MIIKHKKSSIYLNLSIGLALLSFITYATFEKDGDGFKIYYIAFYISAGYYMLLAFFKWRKPLIYLRDKEIIFYSFPNKKTAISTNEVSVKYEAGDYIFTTDKAYIYRVTKSQIPTNQISFVESYINSL